MEDVTSRYVDCRAAAISMIEEVGFMIRNIIEAGEENNGNNGG